MIPRVRHELGDLPQLFAANDAEATVLGMTVRHGRMELVLHVDAGEGFSQRRRVTCDGVTAWTLTAGPLHRFGIAQRHAALLPHTDEHADLFFSSAPEDPLRAAAGLREAHAALAGRYIDFDSVINRAFRSLGALLRNGHGKVASGPVTLLQGYQQVLEASGSETTLLRTWAPPARELSLLDLGHAWVVAETFTVARG